MIVYDINDIKNKIFNISAFLNMKISNELLHEVVVTYLNNQRSGTHKSKTRGDVCFSGRKPWAQKGTGRARSGQKNSPLWRKGGVIFGPQPKDYYIKISKRKKKISLNMALSLKFKSSNVIVVDSINIDNIKTKKVIEILKNLKIIDKKNLFIMFDDSKFKISARNIKNVFVVNVKNVNVYQILFADKLIFTIDSLNYITDKIKN
jgi:large subunit ribosomal protein L4